MKAQSVLLILSGRQRWYVEPLGTEAGSGAPQPSRSRPAASRTFSRSPFWSVLAAIDTLDFEGVLAFGAPA